MKYKLKKGVESFEVVDGPMAGRKFLRGKVYKEIPSGEAKKFEKIEEQKMGKRKEETVKTKESGKSKEQMT